MISAKDQGKAWEKIASINPPGAAILAVGSALEVQWRKTARSNPAVRYRVKATISVKKALVTGESCISSFQLRIILVKYLL